jgi:hypothetical protein
MVVMDSGFDASRRRGMTKKAGIAPGLFVFLLVMPGLVPGIHALLRKKKVVDGRVIWCEDALRAFARP